MRVSLGRLTTFILSFLVSKRATMMVSVLLPTLSSPTMRKVNLPSSLPSGATSGASVKNSTNMNHAAAASAAIISIASRIFLSADPFFLRFLRLPERLPLMASSTALCSAANSSSLFGLLSPVCLPSFLFPYNCISFPFLSQLSFIPLIRRNRHFIRLRPITSYILKAHFKP